MATVTITLTDNLEKSEDDVSVNFAFDPPLTDDYIAGLDRPTAAHDAAWWIIENLRLKFGTEPTVEGRLP